MMYRDDDALDRALFALPLEQPPADLRASILTATVYRPGPAFSIWEIAAFGSLAALIVWLVAALAMGGGERFEASLAPLAAGVIFAARSLLNVTTLMWLGIGGAVAMWMSLFTESQPFALAAQRFARRSGR